jgi:SAM-dependent methyltransferase
MMPASAFGRVAGLYARVRPGYAPQVFDDIVALSGLREGGRILEIGPATGQATIPLARRGYRITAVEPDAPLVAEAQRLLGANTKVEFHIATFEDWPLPGETFDLVLAATAFHWIDPDVRYVKSAAALMPGGALAVINTHHVAGRTQTFFEEVQVCYARHMPTASPPSGLRPADAIAPDIAGFVASGLFAEPMVRRYLWQQTYTAREYTDLLSTYSDHIALSETKRRALFACIKHLIDTRFGGKVEKQYMTELIVAKRQPHLPVEHEPAGQAN